MKKQMADHTRTAVRLCTLMLFCCLLALARYLAPVLTPAETKGDSFGMVLIDIADEETADSYHVEACGVYVLAVQEHSQAALADVSAGDLLVSVNENPVVNTGEFVVQQERFAPGDTVELGFQRGNGGPAYAVSMVWNEE